MTAIFLLGRGERRLDREREREVHKQIDGVGLMGLLCEENEKERDIDSKVASEYFSLSCLALLLHAFVIFSCFQNICSLGTYGFCGDESAQY